MLIQNNFCSSQQTTSNFNFKRHRGIILALLVCLIGLLPIHSFAQPLASGKSKFVGNVISNGNSIHSNFSMYWNQVTPENAGKWASVEIDSGQYNWIQLDKIYNYALANGFPYKHHNLIWGQQQPTFINNFDSAGRYQEIVKWIDTSGQRYPKADFCDVVNEPIHTPPSYKSALGGNGTTGWDWVINAFQLARQYWPNTKLLINEYSVINDNSANAQYITIINLLKARGLIDGIGVQGHYFEVDGGASIATLQNNLNNLAATGLPIYISEFDINQANDTTQLQRYQTIFPALYEHPGVKGITLWGYVEYETWKTDTYLITDRLVERPALQWLRTYLASPMRPLLISPVGTTGESLAPLLSWHSSDSATSYRLQVALNSAFSSVVIDSTVADTLLQLDTLAAKTIFYWRVTASNDIGTSGYSAVASFTTGDAPTDVKEVGGIPKEFALLQNYPNPFNPSTTIRYDLPKIAYVKITVYDVLGRLAATLVDGVQSANRYSVEWNPSHLGSGVYFCRIQARGQDGSGEFTSVKKLLFVK
jgi:endo-1,4-beta-xylanase